MLSAALVRDKGAAMTRRVVLPAPFRCADLLDLTVLTGLASVPGSQGYDPA
jgi:hypothetical protein